MANVKELWVIVADSQCARLLHGTATQHAHLHLDEVGTIATTFVAGEHHRPTRLSEPGRSGPTGHDHEQKTEHFAREVAPWIEQEMKARGIAGCALFAPSHFLGAMRKAVGKGMAGKVTEHEGELAQLSAGTLSKHPRIVGLFPK